METTNITLRLELSNVPKEIVDAMQIGKLLNPEEVVTLDFEHPDKLLRKEYQYEVIPQVLAGVMSSLTYNGLRSEDPETREKFENHFIKVMLG